MNVVRPTRRNRKDMWGLLAESKEPLFRSGHSLILSSVVTSSIGLAFWILAAHRYRPSIVGANSAVLTTLAFLSGVAQLNLSGALTRFVPVAGRKRGKFIAGAYAASATISAGLAILFLSFATHISRSFEFLHADRAIEIWWVVAAIGWGIFVLEDGALVGLRRARWVPVENAGFSVLKLVLVVVLASSFRHSGIFYSWTIASIATVIPLNVYLFTRAVRQEEERDPVGDVAVGHLVRYVPYDYIASLAWLGATSLLPLMIVRRVGTAANAYFSLAWLVAYVMYLASINVGSSLIVEASSIPGELERQTWRVIVHLYKLLVPTALVVVVGAPEILRLFGKEYASAGVTTLRLLALSSLPFVITSTAVSALRARRNTKAVLMIDASICVGAVTISWVLLPSLGTVGAGWAWLICQVATATFLMIRRRRWLPDAPGLEPAAVRLRLAGALASTTLGVAASEVRSNIERRRADRFFAGIYDGLVAELSATEGAIPSTSPTARVQRSASDLTVALLEDASGAPLGVVKVPRSARALTDLRNGRSAVSALASDERLGTWRCLLPTSTLHHTQATPFSLESHIAGKSAEELIGSAPARTAQFVQRALESIGELHAATAHRATIDDGTFDTLTRAHFEMLRSVHPAGCVPDAQRLAVDKLQMRLRDACVGRSVALSYVHGDYSPGNVVLSCDGDHVTGILDWGQCRTKGLPVVDVLSLISAVAYRTEGVQFGAFIVRILEEEAWPDDPLLALAKPAIASVDIDHHALVLWCWLEHIGGNLQKSERYARNSAWWGANVDPVLRAVGA